MECDVVVIGAGLAGLTAAAEIRHKDPTLAVTVIEARDRVGGRVHTVRMGEEPGASMDLGGQFFCNSQKPILELLDILQLRTVRVSSHQGLTSLYWGSGANKVVKGIWGGGIGSWLRSCDMSRTLGKVKAMAEDINVRYPYRNAR